MRFGEGTKTSTRGARAPQRSPSARGVHESFHLITHLTCARLEKTETIRFHAGLIVADACEIS